jgi:hypothetical protein
MDSKYTDKKVKYANTCAVILIPSRKEYQEAGIDLWYNRKDHASAENQVAAELKKVMDFNPSLSLSLAMKFLYQPRMDYKNAIYNYSTVQDFLNILIIDENQRNSMDNANLISQFLIGYNRWIISYTFSDSIESALQALHHIKTTNSTTSTSNNNNNTNAIIKSNSNVILIDEKISDFNQFKQLRSVYGSSLLLGMLISNSQCESMRQHAVEAGVDFIWPKPIHGSIDMLPLILASRRKSKLFNNAII